MITIKCPSHIRAIILLLILAPVYGTAAAALIFDNTPNAGKAGVTTNLRTGSEGQVSGCSKDQALYQKACNSFNINAIQVMQSTPQGELTLEIGVHNVSSTSYENTNKDSRLNYFANGTHLFDLDKLRAAAGALGTLTTSLPPGTYGTLSWQQFIDNVVAARTMYGIVRVLAPLQDKGAGKNALNESVQHIYGFCSGTAGGCACAPNSNTDIKPGETVCGRAIGAGAQINVRGALFIDFVDSVSNAPIPLSALPFSPRDIYFKVAVPINVNAANDTNRDGVLDNIDKIAALTRAKTCPAAVSSCSVPMPLKGADKLTLADVPAESLARYAYVAGAALTAAQFDALPPAAQYHLLMASGYEQGWIDAFTALGVTPTYWATLGFEPGTTNAVFTIDDIRSDLFEDIPAYLYSGGLVDMHHHVNISGLVYVPQAMELEQKQVSSRQYVMGSVVVRDAFFIEDGGGVTLLSTDPDAISRIKVANGLGGSFTAFSKSELRAQGGKGNAKGVGANPGKGAGAGANGNGKGKGAGGTPAGSTAGGTDTASGTSGDPTQPADAAEPSEPFLVGPQAVEIRPQI